MWYPLTHTAKLKSKMALVWPKKPQEVMAGSDITGNDLEGDDFTGIDVTRMTTN